MKNLKLILKNWNAYKQWKSIRRGQEPINLKRGVGYYFITGMITGSPVGRVERLEMQSGRTAIVKLISYHTFNDPPDMIKESFWHMSGYEGEKLFKDMCFGEFLASAVNFNP